MNRVYLLISIFSFSFQSYVIGMNQTTASTSAAIVNLLNNPTITHPSSAIVFPAITVSNTENIDKIPTKPPKSERKAPRNKIARKTAAYRDLCTNFSITTDKDRTCSICNRTFKQMAFLKRHITQIHRSNQEVKVKLPKN